MALVTAAFAASLGAGPFKPSPWLAVTDWSEESTSAALAAPETPAVALTPPAPSWVRVPAHELDERFAALEVSFRARRTVLAAAGTPITIDFEPQWLRAEFRPSMEALADLGSARAAGWLLRHFHADAAEDAATVVHRKTALYRLVLPRYAQAEWAYCNELDVTASLLIDAPLLGPRLTREFADALLEANAGRFDRRSMALRAVTRSLLGPREVEEGRRNQAAEIWRDEIHVAAGTPFESYARNELWRLENFWIGDRAPAFSAADVDGNEIGLRDFSTKVVVVAFFRLGSRADVAWSLQLRDFARENEHRNVAVLGVELSTNESAFRRLWEENAMRFPCIYERDEPGCVVTAWRLNEVPRALVFDTAGRLRFVDLDGAAFESTVETLLQASDGSASGAHGRNKERR